MHTKFEHKSANPNFENVFDVSPDEVYEKRLSLTLIDVRRPDEYVGELGHAPGAALLTLDFLPQKIHELAQDKTIVFICRSGGRSAQATAFALENGFTDVYNMSGGMLLWNQMQLETQV